MKNLLLTLGILGLLAATATTQMPNAKPPKVAVSLPKTVVVGAVAKGTAKITFPDGWHGYQNPPSDPYQNPITLGVSTPGYKLVKVSYPAGIDFAMTGDPKPSKVYEGTIDVPFEVRVPKKAGKVMVSFTVEYQLCSDSTCLPPSTLTVKAPLTLTPALKATRG